MDHRDEKGNILWRDIDGVSEEVMEIFSKRRQQIEAEEAKFIEEHGRKPTLAENNFLSVSTRGMKMATSDRERVRESQLAQLTENQIDDLKRCYRKAYYDKWMMFNSPKIAQESLKKALALVYERESVVKLDKVLAEALNQSEKRSDENAGTAESGRSGSESMGIAGRSDRTGTLCGEIGRGTERCV